MYLNENLSKHRCNIVAIVDSAHFRNPHYKLVSGITRLSSVINKLDPMGNKQQTCTISYCYFILSLWNSFDVEKLSNLFNVAPEHCCNTVFIEPVGQCQHFNPNRRTSRWRSVYFAV